MSRPTRERPQLLGFGPMGWIAVVFFLALVATQIAGIDLVVLHVNAIHEIGGDEFWDAYFVGFYLWQGLGLLHHDFNLVCMLYVVIAIWLVRVERPWWHYALVVAWAVLRPMPVLWLVTGFGRTVVMMPWLEAADMLVTVVVLWVVTASWRVALCVALLLAAAAAAWHIGDPGKYQQWEAQFAYARILATVWQVLLAAVMLTWAIHRYRHPDSEHCPACGYPVRGLPGVICPECGASAAAQDRAADGVPACGGTAVEVPS